MIALVRTPFGATCKGVLQLEATFIDVSPPGLEPGCLEYDSNALTIKVQRPVMKKKAFHIKVPGDGYTNIPYTQRIGTVFQRPRFESQWRYMFFLYVIDCL